MDLVVDRARVEGLARRQQPATLSPQGVLCTTRRVLVQAWRMP